MKKSTKNGKQKTRRCSIGTENLCFFFIFRKFYRRGTYRLRKNRLTPTILQQDDNLNLMTQSAMNKQKLIEDATRKLREAESKAQDLSINIQSVF